MNNELCGEESWNNTMRYKAKWISPDESKKKGEQKENGRRER